LRLAQTAQDVDLALAQTNVGDVGALLDDGLRDATDIDVLLYARYCHFNVQRDFIARVHLRRHVDVDANVRIVELGRYQWADARSHAPQRGTEAAGSVGNTAADFQRYFLAVGGANLRLVEYFSTTVAQHGLEQTTGQGGRKVR